MQTFLKNLIVFFFVSCLFFFVEIIQARNVFALLFHIILDFFFSLTFGSFVKAISVFSDIMMHVPFDMRSF